jgi:hypothetical protein
MNAAAQQLKPKSAEPGAEAARRAPSDINSAATPTRLLQAKLAVGGVNDPEEREAEHAANVIAAGGRHQVVDPGGSVHLRAAVAPPVEDPGASGRARRAVATSVEDPGVSGRVHRAVAPPIEDPGASGRVRRAPAFAAGGALTGAAAARVEAARASLGRPLPMAIQARLEHGFGQSMDNVRVHTGPAARAAASGIGARAFTEGERITLGHGESEHDLHLMAHEATHVMQNRREAGFVRPLAQRETGAVRREAVPAAKAEQGPIRPLIRRSIISRALDWLADKATRYIPGFDLFTIVLGFNPINGESVDRSGAHVLRAAVRIIPAGDLIVQALDKYGAFNKAGAFVDRQIEALKGIGASIKHALSEFLDSLGWTDIFHPGEVLERGFHIFADPAERIINFIKDLAEGIIQFVKDAVLKPLAGLAASLVPFWDVLVGVFGKNPITGEAAPPVADVLVGGLLKLAHMEEVWENIQKAKALPRIWNWLKSVISQLLDFVLEIPSLFVEALKSFKISDLLDLPGAFVRVIKIFGRFVIKFASWVGAKIWALLEIVFEVVSPQALFYIKKTGAALKSILKNPLPFVKNLVASAKHAFDNFREHFVDHLKAGLLDWLTGSLPGVYIPQAFTLLEFGKFALSVLGITWAQIRAEIVKALGPKGETIMSALEKTFDIVVAVVKGGVGAAWDLIKENLSNLKDTLIDGIVGMVKDTIIFQAVPKVLAMFIPGAGFVSAIISIYNTIKTFIEKLSQIAEVVKSFIESIVAIAQGQIAGAAKRVETALAGGLKLAIAFLASFAGLGGVAEKVRDVIKKVWDAVQKAIMTAANWVVGKAKAAFAWLFGKGDKDGKPDERTDKEKQNDLDKGLGESKALLQDDKRTSVEIAKQLSTIQSKYKLTMLTIVTESKTKNNAKVHVHGEVNPEGNTDSVERATAEAVEIITIKVNDRRVLQKPVTGAEFEDRVIKLLLTDSRFAPGIGVIGGQLGELIQEKFPETIIISVTTPAKEERLLDKEEAKKNRNSIIKKWIGAHPREAYMIFQQRLKGREKEFGIPDATLEVYGEQASTQAADKGSRSAVILVEITLISDMTKAADEHAVRKSGQLYDTVDKLKAYGKEIPIEYHLITPKLEDKNKSEEVKKFLQDVLTSTGAENVKFVWFNLE